MTEVKLKRTTGKESVEGYIQTYGFCHWQAQEVMKERDALQAKIDSLMPEYSQRSQLRALALAEIGEEALSEQLCSAAANGLFSNCEALLRLGANPNWSRHGTNRALNRAAANNHAALCDLLIRNGADLEGTEFVAHGTALYSAYHTGHRDCALVLLANGASPSVLRSHGDYPLRATLKRKSTSWKDQLPSWTPHQAAVRLGWAELVKRTLQTQALEPGDNHTSLVLLAKRTNHESLIPLIEAHAAAAAIESVLEPLSPTQSTSPAMARP